MFFIGKNKLPDNFYGFDELAKTFIKDHNLDFTYVNPKQFMYSLKMRDSDEYAIEKWDYTRSLIFDTFNGNVWKYYAYRDHVMRDVIQQITSTDAYRQFINGDMSKYQTVDAEKARYKTHYNEECLKKVRYFFSVDMNNANFQSMSHVDSAMFMGDMTYGAFISRFTTVPDIVMSKHFRSVLFGKLCPKRTVQVTRHLMGGVEDTVRRALETKYKHCTLVCRNTDEVIYETDRMVSPHDAMYIRMLVDRENKISVKTQCFTMDGYKLVCDKNTPIDTFYVSHDIVTGHDKTHSMNARYANICHKLLEGKKVRRMDRLTRIENVEMEMKGKFKIEKIKKE